jgi:hypothetical protein
MERNQSDAVKALAERADVVAVGRVQRLGTPPRAWSGMIAMFQEVRYGPVRFLKKPRQMAQVEAISVAHPIVARSRTASSNEPGLNPALFRLGAELVLFIRVNGGKLQTFDENFGVLPAEKPLLEELGKLLR